MAYILLKYTMVDTKKNVHENAIYCEIEKHIFMSTKSLQKPRTVYWMRRREFIQRPADLLE